MVRRKSTRDLAVVVGVPVAFAILASVLSVAAPSSAAGPAPTVAPDDAPVAAARPTTPEPAAADPLAALDNSEALLPTPAARPLSAKDVKVVSRIKTRKPVFFVTIDDGSIKSADALRVVRRNQIPVTVFLTAAAIGDQAEYFEDIASYGGSVQNHTYHHKYLNQATTDVDAEVCGIQRRYKRLFGQRPWMLRPPGGFGPDSTRLHEVVASCGIDRIVMWNVVVTDTSVQYQNPPLRRGDIVILHFTRGLGPALERLLALGRKQGLRPASLEEYLRPPHRTSNVPGGSGSG